MNTSLSYQERVVSLAIVQLFVVVAVATYLNAPPQIPPFPPVKSKKQSVLVKISGSVCYPGEYELDSGVSVNQLLNMAKPFPEANLKPIRRESKLLRPRTIVIQEKKRIK